MIRSVSFVVALLILTVGANSALAGSSIEVGKVTYVSGDTFVIRDAERLPLTDGDALFPSDTIVTGKRGRVMLYMRDGSRLHISRLSRLSLSGYRFKEDDSLVSGAFNMLWGKVRFFVAKLNKGSTFNVNTSTAVLGVRGTEFLVVVPIPGGITDPTAIKLPPDLPPEITEVVGVEGLVVGLSKSGESIMISPGVTVEFTLDDKLIFRFVDEPNAPKLPAGEEPSMPNIPDPSDIQVPEPPQLPQTPLIDVTTPLV